MKLLTTNVDEVQRTLSTSCISKWIDLEKSTEVLFLVGLICYYTASRCDSDFVLLINSRYLHFQKISVFQLENCVISST